MSVILALVTTIALIDGAAAAAPTDRCDVPDSFLSSESDLTNVTNEVKARQRLDISVIGTGSSALAGVDGVHYAYPMRLEQALQQQLKGITVKVTAHIQPRVSTADMVPGLAKILADDMRIVAQQHNALLFDRLGIMRSWNDSGTFDLYTATKNYDMARRVHDCIGRALATQIISAAHLDAMRMQTTR